LAIHRNDLMGRLATTAIVISSIPWTTSLLVFGRTKTAAIVSVPLRFSTSRFLPQGTCKKPTLDLVATSPREDMAELSAEWGIPVYRSFRLKQSSGIPATRR